MNTTDVSKAHSAKDLIEALSTARSRARVQMHLLSLDARDSWHELESKIETMQSQLEHDSDRLSGSAAKKVRELTQAVKELLQQNGGVAELAVRAARVMRPAQTCRPSDTLNDAARLMWELDCGAVPVVNDAGSVVGMLTDRDICMAVYTRGQTLSAFSVESAMASDVATAAANDPLETITRLMRQRRVRRVPIVDDGRLVGIVSLADIARHLESDGGFSAVASLELARTLAAVSESARGAASAAAE